MDVEDIIYSERKEDVQDIVKCAFIIPHCDLKDGTV